MTERPRHCPFCGYETKSDELGWAIIVNTNTGERFFQCDKCKARGPSNNCKTNEEAVAAWNTRTEENNG